MEKQEELIPVAIQHYENYIRQTPGLTKTMIPTNGIKHDSGKPRFELYDTYFLEDVARVLTLGAQKYADNNWQEVRPWKRYLGALFRHSFAILRGEVFDNETGLQHAAHAAANLMFIHYMIRKGIDANSTSE